MNHSKALRENDPKVEGVESDICGKFLTESGAPGRGGRAGRQAATKPALSSPSGTALPGLNRFLLFADVVFNILQPAFPC